MVVSDKFERNKEIIGDWFEVLSGIFGRNCDSQKFQVGIWSFRAGIEIGFILNTSHKFLMCCNLIYFYHVPILWRFGRTSGNGLPDLLLPTFLFFAAAFQFRIRSKSKTFLKTSFFQLILVFPAGRFPRKHAPITICFDYMRKVLDIWVYEGCGNRGAEQTALRGG
jgi:hypothetical protein